ncbi:MAG: hypothetical protein WBC36_13005 [Desulfobacterales bacterium]
MSIKSSILDRIIRKILCVSLVLFLIYSPFAMAAEVPSVCENKCCIKADTRGHGGSIDSKLTALASGCCSDSQDHPCNFEKRPNFDVSGVIMLSVRVDQPDLQFFIAEVNDVFFENPAKKGFGGQFHSRALPRSAPIYLYNLSLLC